MFNSFPDTSKLSVHTVCTSRLCLCVCRNAPLCTPVCCPLCAPWLCIWSVVARLDYFSSFLQLNKQSTMWIGLNINYVRGLRTFQVPFIATGMSYRHRISARFVYIQVRSLASLASGTVPKMLQPPLRLPSDMHRSTSSHTSQFFRQWRLVAHFLLVRWSSTCLRANNWRQIWSPEFDTCTSTEPGQLLAARGWQMTTWPTALAHK